MTRNLAYPATLTPDREAGGFTVTFRDLPEAITQGQDRLNPPGDEIPAPSKTRASQAMVPVPPLIAAKAALYLAMREAEMSNVKLAKQLGCDEKDVRRMLDPRHNSRITALQGALAVLGKKIVVAVADAA